MRSNRGKSLIIFLIIIACLTGVLVISTWKKDWGFLAAILVFGVLILGYGIFEQGSISSREIGVIAVLGTVAALGRVPFAALPNIQPATFVIIVSGFVFGPRAGFMVGSTTAVASNFFLGQGPWTPWQMFAWGLVGTTAGMVKGCFGGRFGHVWIAAFSFGWGYLYGWIMNFWFWITFIQPLNWKSFLTTFAAGFWFDTCHALSNLGLYLLLGPRVIRALERFQRKLKYTFVQS